MNDELSRTYGFCVYHEIECDYRGLCVDCPYNTEEDIKWFKSDESKGEKGGENDK